METQTTPNSQSNLEGKNRSGGINLPAFRLHYKATVTKTVWYLHKNRSTAQWDEAESSARNPRTYGHLTFDRGGKNNEEKTASSISGARKPGQLHVKECN